MGTAASIAARMQGDDYQARWFFIQALRMLERDSAVIRVGLEQGTFPWFDDIVTHFAAGKRASRRAADAHQIKFHVVANGSLSFATLIDPAFISSKQTSLLQRIIEAYRSNADADVVLMSPWGIQHDDLLARMAQIGSDGSMRLHLLFDGKKKSEAAETRTRLLAHAAVDEDELREALDRFRVAITPPLPLLQAMLDDKLARHHFVPVGEQAMANIYDDLGRKLIGQPNREFDRESLRKLLADEDLVDHGEARLEPLRVGIRSFVRQAEYLDEFTDLLDLLDAFEQRDLRAGASWQAVRDRVLRFITEIDDARHADVEMHLSCHISIAFTAGRAVSAKSGTRYRVHQTGRGGAADWDLSTRAEGSAEAFWSLNEIRLREGAPDVAVAIGLTHAIGRDVERYVGRHAPSVGTLLVLEPTGGPSQSAVRDGAHAAALAETFDQLIAARRTPEQRTAMLHLFAAAPNAFTFALGRAAQRIARVTLYEYDFVQKDPEGYSPSITLDMP
jgi:hypothetical protein